MAHFFHRMLSVLTILLLALPGSVPASAAGMRLRPPNPPVITEGDSISYTMRENKVISFALHATDDDPLTWSVLKSPGHGAPALSPSTGGSTTVTYKPLAFFTGADSFIVQVADDREDVDQITVYITVEPNHPPVITEGESTSFTICEGKDLSFPLHATDPDGDPITWSILKSAPHGAASLWPSAGSSTTVQYTPLTKFNGVDSFTVQAEDDQDGEDTITVLVFIGCNHPPVIIEGDSTSFTICEGSSVGFSLHAVDVDGDPLTWSISKQPSTGSPALTTYTGASTTIDYTPKGEGSESFAVKVSDGQGGSDTYTANVMVRPLSDCQQFVRLPYICRLVPDCFESALEIESNNSFPGANGPLCLGRLYQGHPNDPNDFFYFDLKDTATVEVEMENLTQTGAQLLVYDSTGKIRLGWRNTAPYTIALKDAPPGRYFIWVYTAYGYNDRDLYSLKVSQ